MASVLEKERNQVPRREAGISGNRNHIVQGLNIDKKQVHFELLLQDKTCFTAQIRVKILCS